MKKFIFILSFFMLMFFLGMGIRKQIDKGNITFVEYSHIGEEKEKLTIKKKDIKDKKIKSMIDSKDDADCTFSSYVPKCVRKEMRKDETYDMYYIIYFGDNSYKVIYDKEDIEYISKFLEQE